MTRPFNHATLALVLCATASAATAAPVTAATAPATPASPLLRVLPMPPAKLLQQRGLQAAPGLAPAAASPPLAPIGPAVRISPDGVRAQGTQYAVASDADGDFVVVWSEIGSGTCDDAGFSGHVMALRHSRDGLPLGSAFQLSSGTGAHISPAVAMDAAGNFLVTWNRCTPDGGDADEAADTRVLARRVALGGRLGPVQVLSARDGRTEILPQAAMAPGGAAVVTWSEQDGTIAVDRDGDGSNEENLARGGVFVQRFDATGAPAGSPLQANDVEARTTNLLSAAAMSANGDFLVAWEALRFLGDGAADGIPLIVGQRYTAAGGRTGPNFTFNDDPDQVPLSIPSLAMQADGAFAAGWSSFAVRDPDGDGNPDLVVDAVARRYDAAGNPLAGSFDVEFFSSLSPSLALDGSGGLTIAYKSLLQLDDPQRLMLRSYDATGAQIGEALRLRSADTLPALAADADGDLRLAWNEDALSDAASMFVQRLRGPREIDLGLQSVTSTVIANGSGLDGTLVLRVRNFETAEAPTGIAAHDRALGAAGGTGVSLVLPEDGEFVGGTGQGWTCTGAGSAVLCSLAPALEAGRRAADVSIAYRANAGGTLLARAFADAADPDESNNTRTFVLSAAGAAPASAAVGEGGSRTLRVSLSAPTASEVRIPFTISGSATQGADFTASGGGVAVIPAGRTTRVLTVISALDDDLAEGDETVVVTLGTPSGGVVLGNTTSTVTIADDDD